MTRPMRLLYRFTRILALPAVVTALTLTGCSHTTYVAAPPPPPPAFQGPPPLVEVAERNGLADGRQIGAADAYAGRAYAPRHTRAFHDTPGYRPDLGPIGPYRNAYRNAFERGYNQGFYRR